MRRSQYNTKDFKKLNKIPLFLIVTLCAVLCVQCALADPGFFFWRGESEFLFQGLVTEPKGEHHNNNITLRKAKR